MKISIKTLICRWCLDVFASSNVWTLYGFLTKLKSPNSQTSNFLCFMFVCVVCLFVSPSPAPPPAPPPLSATLWWSQERRSVQGSLPGSIDRSLQCVNFILLLILSQIATMASSNVWLAICFWSRHADVTQPRMTTTFSPSLQWTQRDYLPDSMDYICESQLIFTR